MTAKDELEGVRPHLPLKVEGSLATPFSLSCQTHLSICLSTGPVLVELVSTSTMLAVVQ